MEYKFEDSVTSIDQKIISNACKLQVEIIEAKVLPLGTVLLINAGGYIDSKRNNKDGHTYFGTDQGYVRNFSFIFVIRTETCEMTLLSLKRNLGLEKNT